MIEKGRILAVDPGSKHIGLALSDPGRQLARPLQVITHVSLRIDAAQIGQFASDNQVNLILIGFPTGGDGELIPQGRHAQKLAEAIRTQSSILVELWDETNSTQIARSSLLEMNVAKSKRGGHQDALAAAEVLQSYLDSKRQENE